MIMIPRQSGSPRRKGMSVALATSLMLMSWRPKKERQIVARMSRSYRGSGGVNVRGGSHFFFDHSLPQLYRAQWLPER